MRSFKSVTTKRIRRLRGTPATGLWQRNYRDDEWVRGDVHTNSVEGVWSLLKRSVVGSCHQLSAKHLQAYVDEFSWRFNNRHNDYLFRDTLMKLVDSTNLPYEILIAEA